MEGRCASENLFIDVKKPAEFPSIQEESGQNMSIDRHACLKITNSTANIDLAFLAQYK